jgi:hypothetical protein
MKDTKRTWLAAAFAAVAIAGCGGGGEAGPPPAPPPIADTPAPAPPTGLSGRLWHNNYALDFLDGTQIASPSGALPSVASAHDYATPWPDGSQFVYTEWNVHDDYSDLVVVDLASGMTRYRLNTAGFLRNEQPSPVSKDRVMATIGEDSVSPADTIFIDLPTMAVLRRFSADAPVTWLPDGRYLRVLADGTMRAGEVTGVEQTVGRIEPPPSHSVRALWVNRQGTKIAMRLLHDGSLTDETDIWLADMDGSRLERLTSTKMSAYAHWSPDGRHIAFDVDTGHFCTYGGCIGTCELWVVPATARNVTALPAAGDALRFRVKNRHGSEYALGCDLRGWTD